MTRLKSMVLAAAIAALFAGGCGGDTATPSPTATPVPPPSPLELLTSDQTDAVVVGRVLAESGPDSTFDEDGGGFVYRRWTIEVTELLKGRLSGDLVRVRVNTHTLGTPAPTTGVRSGELIGAPMLRPGETVLLFLTRDQPLVRPVSYPPLEIDEFMLVGPNVGKWVLNGGSLRCDDPQRAEDDQVIVPYAGTLELLRAYADED